MELGKQQLELSTGIAKLEIPETGEVFDVNPSDLHWDYEHCDAGGMGERLQHYATISFSSDRGNYEVEVTWSIWEYPIGRIEDTETIVKVGKLVQDFDGYKIPLDDELYEDQLDAILSNTKFHNTFLGGISSLRVLNNISIQDLDAERTLKRQIFIGAITCLETYLSDAFINTVISNKEYLKSFFCSFEDFKKEKITKSEIFTAIDDAEKTAKEAMLKVLYHKLPKVKEMYESTFKIVFPDFSEVNKFVIIRHDLVHRNGKDKAEKYILVDTTSVDQAIDKIENFIRKVEEKLRDMLD